MLETIINDKNISNEDNIMEYIKEKLSLPLGVPTMPIQDAIDFVEFLADLTSKMSKFLPGAQIVGGDIDIAVITKHEHFKWIKRKYFYDKMINE